MLISVVVPPIVNKDCFISSPATLMSLNFSKFFSQFSISQKKMKKEKGQGMYVHDNGEYFKLFAVLKKRTPHVHNIFA